jgi:hypothetical protein
MLSDLDSYFCQLYDEYFAQARDFNTTVTFRYDYTRLARTLLKIAFNSARAAGSEYEYLKRLRSYVLTGEPTPSQLSLFAELVSPTLVKDDSQASGTRVLLPSGFYRSAITKLLTPHGERVRTRIVAVNSFYFHLVLPAFPMMAPEFDEAASELGQYISGVVRLAPELSEVILQTSPQDAISSAVPHLRQHHDTYRDFFERRKR